MQVLEYAAEIGVLPEDGVLTMTHVGAALHASVQMMAPLHEEVTQAPRYRMYLHFNFTCTAITQACQPVYCAASLDFQLILYSANSGRQFAMLGWL